jgi:hypothetical protein
MSDKSSNSQGRRLSLRYRTMMGEFRRSSLRVRSRDRIEKRWAVVIRAVQVEICQMVIGPMGNATSRSCESGSSPSQRLPPIAPSRKLCWGPWPQVQERGLLEAPKHIAVPSDAVGTQGKPFAVLSE